MVNYVLSSPTEFVGVDPQLLKMQVFLSPGGNDDPNTRGRGFAPKSNTKIGSSSVGNNYTGLKIFNGTITGSRLDKLFQDLNKEKILVNLDGYMYLERETRRSTGQLPTARFVRLNDVFPWEEYVDNASTFKKAEKATTVWNRWNYLKPKTKPEVDYGKLDADLKKVTRDNKAKIDKLETEKATLDKQMKDVEFDFMNAAVIGARPLPWNFFERHTLPRSARPYTPRLADTPIGQSGTLTDANVKISDPGTLQLGRVIKRYANHDEFDYTYWRAATLFTNGPRGPQRMKIAYYDGHKYGYHPRPCEKRPWPVNAEPVDFDVPSGFLTLRHNMDQRVCVVIGPA